MRAYLYICAKITSTFTLNVKGSSLTLFSLALKFLKFNSVPAKSMHQECYSTIQTAN